MRDGLLMVVFLSSMTLPAQQKPTAETASWWAQTTALANDGMEGRDTGTAAYERAAKYVAEQFAAAGLKPAGEGGTFFQRVPMHQVDLDADRSSISIEAPNDSKNSAPFGLLGEMTVAPRAGMNEEQTLELMFVGYGPTDAAEATYLKGKAVVFFNNAPASLSASERASFAARRTRALTEAGAAALIAIENPSAIEPTHWPVAYARSVQLAPVGAPGSGPLVFRADWMAGPRLFHFATAYGHSPFDNILRDGERGTPLSSFPLNAMLHIKLHTTEKEISSPNILAVLPGSDPKLAGEYVALSAHLDGYGFGTPVAGDTLYNGALDDAAYVALLIEVAKDLHAKAPGRSLLFCAFTGEEKGLLGSAWFTAHPTVPMGKIVADLNLDQLRPIFPLKILTMEGIDDSTLGATVKGMAKEFGIEVRPDREPERNLFRRADNYNFVKAGVPIASFIFGYDPGSAEETVYRDWYARRYHKPQDDLATPINWEAAAKFNRFYERLAVTVANATVRPAWLSGSAYAPR